MVRRDEIGDELELHLEQLRDEFIRQGMSPEEARLAARRQFGNGTVIKEQCRELFSFVLLRDLARDLHYAGRILRRTPMFFAGAALVLALGIGANCAIFNLVYTVLLRPLPYERPEEVVMVWGGEIESGYVSSRTIRHWREHSAGVFSDFAVIKLWETQRDARFDIVRPDGVERVRAAFVTPNFFSVLGTQAEAGRVFTVADEARGRDDLIVLSYGFWQRQFGGDPAIIGRSVRITSGLSDQRVPRLYTVIGVLPQAFRFTYPLSTEIWGINPWRIVESALPSLSNFTGAVARLAPGVSPQAAESRLVSRAEPTLEDSSLMATKVQPVADYVVREARSSMYLLTAVSVLLLMIACATVSNAVLVRVAERKREFAMRVSLGAGRGRIIRQLLTEGLALSLFGTLGGVLLTVFLLPVFRSIVPVVLPRGDEMTIEWNLLAIPAGAATLITLFALLAPAIQGSRPETMEALKGSSGTITATRWRFAFVAVQTTVATSLVVCAALLLISFWRLHRVDLGFDGKGVLTAEVNLLGPERSDLFQREVMRQVRSLPGVLEVGFTSAVPFRGFDIRAGFRRWRDQEFFWASQRDVDPAYFSIMRITLLRGRLITDQDTPSGEPVVVISESFARRLFPGEDPIDQHLYPRLDMPVPPRIIGIVKDVRYQGLDLDPLPAVYAPRAQHRTRHICLVLRTSGDGQAIAASLRRVIHEINPTIPVVGITTIDQIISDSQAGRRFYTTATVAFAILALALTTTGLIVIVARSIAERRRELAIRTALGAQRARLVGLVVRQGLTPVLLGVAFGLTGAWSGARILEQFLFDVKVHEPIIYAGAGVFTLAIAVLACLVPARHAADMTLTAALQSE